MRGVGKLKGRDVFLLTLVAVLLIGLLWYFLLYGASKSQIDGQRSALDGLQAQVQRSRQATAELPSLRARVAQLEVKRDELLRALPATAKFGAVLSDIRSNLLAAGAQLTGVTQSAGQTAGLPPGVRPIGINLNVSGTFEQMYGALRSIEDMSRFSTIDGVNLTLGQATSFDPDLTGQLGVTVYTFDPAAAGAGGAPGAVPLAPAAPATPGGSG